MNLLYSCEEIAEATGGELRNTDVAGVSSISIDSREIEPGALFVAIKGENFDGHDYAAKAVEAGAALAMVSVDHAERYPDLPLIVVRDALDGLVNLARQARARSAAKIVAVTGSAGKTTTKEAIRLVFEGAGATHASIRSFNNHWGVPLMLARMPRETEYAIFEIGMNHAGEIEPLSKLVQPHVAVVTTIAAAHLEFFDSIEDIARAKAEIFSGVEAGGTAIVGADHDYLDILVSIAREHALAITRFGFANDADVPIRHFALREDGASFTAGLKRGEVSVQIAAPGRHMAANATAALCAAETLGLNIGKASDALAGFGAPEGRGAVSRLGDPGNPVILIDESYNANPASMAAALDVFGNRPRGEGRKVLVLGDMLELGEASGRLHAALKTAVLDADADMIYLCGEKMATLAEALGDDRVTLLTDDVAALNQAVPDQLANGDTVMVKGSNGVGLSALIARIRSRFDV